MHGDASIQRMRELFVPGAIFESLNGLRRQVIRVEEDDNGPYVVYQAVHEAPFSFRRTTMVQFYRWARPCLPRADRFGKDRVVRRK